MVQSNNKLLRLSPLIVECATEKVSTFIITLKSICSKNFCFNEQNIFLNFPESLKQKSIIPISLFFCSAGLSSSPGNYYLRQRESVQTVLKLQIIIILISYIIIYY
jgi:hypothetical protein